MRDMTIHFICTGNMYRSRLAEAYCVSKDVPGLGVSSSGINAALNGPVPIAAHAADVLHAYGLERFSAPSWQQTTMALVRASDVLVFMEKEHYQFCKDWVDSNRQTVEIWDIPDVGPNLGPAEIITKVERTFVAIQQRTDRLLTELGFS